MVSNCTTSPPSLGLNQVSGSSLATNPTIELHQNGSISLHSQATPLLGQVGLSHQVIETRTTIYSPNRVRVHTVIDYFPLETPPPALPPRNFNGATHNGTNIIRTQFHTVVDPLSIPNTSVNFHNQPVSHSMNLTRVNQVFPNEMFHQTISRNQPTQIQNNANGVTVCSPVSVHNLDTDDEVASPDELAITLGSQNSSVSKNDQEQVENLMNPVVPPQNPQVDGGYQEVSYGTKSFPHKKYGPYTCARCQGKYETSQSFASHMALHYKSECRAERKR
ncbi:hypothetical protein L1049_018556 [Liquidambar formosana]|uniref:C2H2-type domain-containing protein n=1 Tax=Liquidambar formosana TaxID=63359 RepID=A0AAP0WN77_LIQFO